MLSRRSLLGGLLACIPLYGMKDNVDTVKHKSYLEDEEGLIKLYGDDLMKIKFKKIVTIPCCTRDSKGFTCIHPDVEFILLDYSIKGKDIIIRDDKNGYTIKVRPDSHDDYYISNDPKFLRELNEKFSNRPQRLTVIKDGKKVSEFLTELSK